MLVFVVCSHSIAATAQVFLVAAMAVAVWATVSVAVAANFCLLLPSLQIRSSS